MSKESLSTGAFVVVVVASAVSAYLGNGDHAGLLITVALALLAPAAFQKKAKAPDGDD